MSMSGQVNQGLKGVRFEGHVDPAELRRAESFRGTDNTLSLVQLPNGRFTIRMHDEVTLGGLVLEAEPAGEYEPEMDPVGPSPLNLSQFVDPKSAPLLYRLLRTGVSPNNVVQSIAVDEVNGFLYTHHVTLTDPIIVPPFTEAAVINRFDLNRPLEGTLLPALDSSQATLAVGHQGLSAQYMPDGTVLLWSSHPRGLDGGAKAVRFSYKAAAVGAIDPPEVFTFFSTPSDNTSSTPTISKDGRWLIVKRQRTVAGQAGYDFRVFPVAALNAAGDYSNAFTYEWWAAAAVAGYSLQDMACDGQHLYVLEGTSSIADAQYLSCYTLHGELISRVVTNIGKQDSALVGAGTFHEPEGLAFATVNGQDVLLMQIASGDSGNRSCRVYGIDLGSRGRMLKAGDYGLGFESAGRGRLVQALPFPDLPGGDPAYVAGTRYLLLGRIADSAFKMNGTIRFGRGTSVSTHANQGVLDITTHRSGTLRYTSAVLRYATENAQRRVRVVELTHVGEQWLALEAFGASSVPILRTDIVFSGFIAGENVTWVNAADVSGVTDPVWGLAYLEHNNKQVVSVDHVYPGPFADDAAAAAGGVIVGGLYRTAAGGIAWRQV